MCRGRSVWLGFNLPGGWITGDELNPNRVLLFPRCSMEVRLLYYHHESVVKSQPKRSQRLGSPPARAAAKVGGVQPACS